MDSESSADRSAAHASNDPTAAKGRRSFARINPTQLLLIVCIAGALGWAGFYGLGMLRSSAFNNDRAFRVLTEVVAQVDNFQGTMSSLITLIPEEVASACARMQTPRSQSNQTPDLKDDKTKRDCESYPARLKLPDITLEAGTLGSDTSAPITACRSWIAPAQSVKRVDFRMSVEDPDRSFTVLGCSASADGDNTILQLKGKLRTSLPLFAAQEFFDQALLTTADGSVLAALPGANRKVDISLQRSPNSDLIVADASELLRIAVRTDRLVDAAQTTDEKHPADSPSEAFPDHPVVFEKTLGGEKYQVYVLPFRTSISWTLTDRRGPSSTLFVVGLKRENVSQQIAYTLWPDGAFVMGIFVLLAVLSWPLIRVRFSAPLEPIPPAIIFASAIALVLIPAVLTVTSVWIWSRVELAYWADKSAERYAGQIEEAVDYELRNSVQILDRYQDAIYLPCEPHRPKKQYELTQDELKQFEDCAKQRLHEIEKNSNGLKSWSPLRTVVALDIEGKNDGPRLSTFDKDHLVPQRKALKLDDREYFKALKRGDAWEQSGLAANLIAFNPASANSPADTSALSEHGFVAQRLFSRADAARTLQVAVPRLPTSDASKMFRGIISGDTRAYSLTASVAQPLLRFAVIDRETGTVVFHSKDERSLVENFFVETEQNAALRARLVRQDPGSIPSQGWLSDHFAGRYLGDPHRFYVRNSSGIPWSVVVFYPTKQLGAVAFEASLAALTTVICVAVVLISVGLLIALVIFLAHPGRRRVRELAGWLWPRERLCRRYPVIAWTGAALALVLLATMAFFFGRIAIAIVLLFLAAISFWLATRLKRRCAKTDKAAQSAESGICERHYIGCLIIAAGILAGLPSLYAALRFYDLSLQSLIDSSLANAATQIERRHRIISDDLIRWEQDDNTRNKNYPPIWELSDSLLHVPGTFIAAANEQSSKWVLTALEGIPYASTYGPPRYDSFLQRIWSARTEAGAPGREPWRVRSIVPAPDEWQICIDDGEHLERVEAFRVRAYQGQELLLAAPYRAPNASTEMIATVVRTGMTVLLAVVTMICVVLLVVVIARRICGSQTIFAVDNSRAPTTLSPEQIPGRWYLLSHADKVFLHELTRDHIVNPSNPSALERLRREGFVRFDPWPQLASDDVKRFVESVDLSQELRQARASRETGSWNWMRMPLMIAFVVILGLFIWFAGSSMQLVTTIFAGIATLLGYLGKAQSFIRGKE